MQLGAQVFFIKPGIDLESFHKSFDRTPPTIPMLLNHPMLIHENAVQGLSLPKVGL
jgi:hypothetical protein